MLSWSDDASGQLLVMIMVIVVLPAGLEEGAGASADAVCFIVCSIHACGDANVS